MYAIEINEEIKLFNSLPKSWGNIIAGFDKFSDEDAKSYGFYSVVIPEDYNENIHILGDLFFDNDKFTYPVSDKTWSESLSELKESKNQFTKNEIKDKLNHTDWYIIRNAETGVEIPSEISTKREEYRAIGVTIENEINALSSKSDVVLYEYQID